MQSFAYIAEVQLNGSPLKGGDEMDRETLLARNAIHGLESVIELSRTMVHLRKEHAIAVLELLKEQSRKQMSSFGDGYAEGYKAKEQEIVRCKDCKHIWWFSEKNGDAVCGNGRHKPDWFCADGERRTDQ